MIIIIQVLINIIFLLIFYIWYTKHHTRKVEDKRTERQIQAEKDMSEHFNALMNYNIDDAYGRG